MYAAIRRRAGLATSSPATTHWLVLLICVGALTLAAILDPAPPGGDVVKVGGVPVPPLCGLKSSTGISCPGCGLTRSWVSAMHGRFLDSFAFHHLGWMAMVYAALQAGRHGFWLAVPARRKSTEHWGRYLDRGVIVLAALLIIRWAILLPSEFGF